MVNNGCLLTDGALNLHGVSLIYIFGSCSEILTSIAYWLFALKYWTASLTFETSIDSPESGTKTKTSSKKSKTKGAKAKAPKSGSEAEKEDKETEQLRRLPMSETRYNCYMRTYILVVIVTKLAFQVYSIVAMHLRCPLSDASTAQTCERGWYFEKDYLRIAATEKISTVALRTVSVIVFCIALYNFSGIITKMLQDYSLRGCSYCLHLFLGLIHVPIGAMAVVGMY